MKNYQQFIFEDYVFDEATKLLTLNYSFDNTVHFTETFYFDFELSTELNHEAIDRAFYMLFIMAGISYYKAYLPSDIFIKKGALNESEANFFSKTYQKGLGEFFYVNQLDPATPVTFPAQDQTKEILNLEGRGLLVGIGGGKDSLVTTELLRDQPDLATWSVGHRPQLEPLVSSIGLPHLYVERQWDRSLLTHNQQGALNGHIPISAILACVGVVVAMLAGKRDVVVSNESSASEPNLHYQGQDINHQYSKSLEFEKDFQALLGSHFGESLRYYSALRPFSELRIAEYFSELGFERYKDHFSSCNRAFTHESHSMFWCGECPKCAFVFLVLTPFVDRAKLEQLFHGKNLLLDPALDNTYRQLLGIEGDKPLECVGEVKESRTAMRLAQSQYSELSKYQFDIPDDYNYQALSQHSMPDEIWQLLQAKLQSLS